MALVEGTRVWKYDEGMNDLRGDPEYPPVRMSFSGAILYCEATSLWTAFSSSRKIFMRMNGSRPFCVSMCHGLGRASRSDTDP